MTIDLRSAMRSWQTLRIAARTWRRTPAHAAVILCTMALGIGATTTAFTIAYSILVQHFPFPNADRLATACTVVIAAAVLAAYLPARRAPRVDPITALRVE